MLWPEDIPDGPEILSLDGTLIYQQSDIVRHMIEKTKARLLKRSRKEGTS